MMKHFSICHAFQNVINKIKEGTYDKNNTDDRDVSRVIFEVSD